MLIVMLVESEEDLATENTVWARNVLFWNKTEENKNHAHLFAYPVKGYYYHSFFYKDSLDMLDKLEETVSVNKICRDETRKAFSILNLSDSSTQLMAYFPAHQSR
jgi:hypothetical protein